VLKPIGTLPAHAGKYISGVELGDLAGVSSTAAKSLLLRIPMCAGAFCLLMPVIIN
jgi:hypothetical protein